MSALLDAPVLTHPLARNHDLGSGWMLSCDGLNDRGAYDWTVMYDVRGRCQSASLGFALEEGTTSCDDERPIPARVLERLDALAEKLVEADLY